MELCAWIFVEMGFWLRELGIIVMMETRLEGMGARSIVRLRRVTPAGTAAAQPHRIVFILEFQ